MQKTGTTTTAQTKKRNEKKLTKMKSVPVKKKKSVTEQQTQNPDNSNNDGNKDYISETISFVIKGKLTPIKPNLVTTPTTTTTTATKKIGGSKKLLTKKVTQTTKKTTTTTKKGNNKQKVRQQVMKKIKKLKDTTKTKPKTTTKKAVTRKSATNQKLLKKTLVNSEIVDNFVLPSPVPPLSQITIPPIDSNLIQKDVELTTSLLNNKSDLSSSNDKKLKKPVKKVKAQTVSKTKRVRKDVKTIKRKKTQPKSINNSETGKQEDNPEQDIKTKQTIEKLLKQANKALKQSTKLKNAKATTTVAKKPNTNNKRKLPNKKIISSNPNAANKSNLVTGELKTNKRKLQEQDTTNLNTTTTTAEDDTSTSDDIILNELRKTGTSAKKLKIDLIEEAKKANKKLKTKPNLVVVKKKRISPAKTQKPKVTASAKRKSKENLTRKMKLFGFWNGPKRHRVASLNALAKVHCLYENETRGNILDSIVEKKEQLAITTTTTTTKELLNEDGIIPAASTTTSTTTRTLRSVPGLRAVGKHWDMHDTTSSSSEDSAEDEKPVVTTQTTKTKVKRDSAMSLVNKKSEEMKQKPAKEPKRRQRNRAEIIMDLKDMVVRKRMASLNATAILAASYSVEKRAVKSPKSGGGGSSSGADESEDDSSDYFETDDDDDDEDDEDNCSDDDDVRVNEKNKSVDSDNNKVKNEDDKLIEVRATPNKKVAVILNQDTDVTITGVYVNSTTRSTHHEGYCSIAGMQYRISATSHTQTASAAVATETLLQSSSSSAQENSNSESLTSCKSYTPLDALSNMQPPPGPGIQHSVSHQHMGPPQHVLPLSQHQLSPSGRRHGCSSAFSAPHSAPPYPPGHHHPSTDPSGYLHGYYQPAGPLISVPHGHTQPPLTKSAPLSETSPQSSSPSVTAHQPPPVPVPPAPSSNGGDSSDSEVIITSITTAQKEPLPAPQQQQQQQQPPTTYRYTQYAPGAPPGYSYTYPHYYPTPPPPPTAASYAHHDLCYPTTAAYLHHKYPPPPPPPTTYRRYLPSTQYYTPNPTDIYTASPTGPTQPSQQVVTATPVSSGSSYQTPPTAPTLMETYPPPPTLVETYPAHYAYPSYGPAPPPSCYTHPAPTRTIPYINATAYQSCPCPMQSCPKNVLTGPLTGDSKRSNISKDSIPLPPVALALPLEPASATGPPSPARGSAGMPPPPSPAGATYHQPPPPTPKQECESPPESTTMNIVVDNTITINNVNNKRKARIGKAMVRNNIAANLQQPHTMLLMCNPVAALTTTTTINRSSSSSSSYTSEVKREIESPKEKDEVVVEVVGKKELCCSSDDDGEVKINLQQQQQHIGEQEKNQQQGEEEQETDKTQQIKDTSTTTTTTTTTSSLLLLETKEDEIKKLKLNEELLQPCINTVAENVKVKNMKRKLSSQDNNKLTTTTTTATELPTPPIKKLKTELKNGSYKNLINKNTKTTTTIKINNGKRKLINGNVVNGDCITRRVSKIPKIKLKKPTTTTTKRKLKVIKDEEPVNKKLKQTTKPLIASNLHNSKQYSKYKNKIINNNNNNNNEKLNCENKEPTTTTTSTTTTRKCGNNKKLKSVNSTTNTNNNNNNNSKCSNQQKKLAPAILDNLIAKNSIDRTIDSVINESIIRTSSALIKTTTTSSSNQCSKLTTTIAATITTTTKETVSCNSKKSTNKNLTGQVKLNNSKKNRRKSKCINNNNNIINNNNNNNSKVDETTQVQNIVAKLPKRLQLQLPKWSNGWTWEGNCYEAKVFLNSDETTVIRKCYPAMRHEEGDIIQSRDCVLLKAGPRKNDLPFVAKIAYLWENPDDGEMMMSLLWYYRPEHTDQGRLPIDQPDEVFASRHKDSNSVACIDDKCYVLTFNEYCRYRKELRRLEEGIEETLPCIPIPEPYPRFHRQPSSPLQVSSDMVFFCRKVYDFRQKRIVKNPS